VKDLDRALDFYTGVLEMAIERKPAISETPWISEVVGYENVKMRQAYVGVGDGHSIELIEYMRPRGEARSDQFERNKPGSAHAAMIVDDVPAWRERLEGEGIKVFGPRYERDLEYPWGRYAIYFHDPDGNWLEMVSRSPKPEGSTAN
jgi:catechol 2,3-dioxygenase-like lactoylglutathione lyase family enzyme